MKSPSLSLEEKVALLTGGGVQDNAHSGTSLLAHLLGTWQLLTDWGEQDYVCDAGLFHSVYGTESYPVTTLKIERRGDVVNMIGPKAEVLTYDFCTMEKKSFYENLDEASTELSVIHRITRERKLITSHHFTDICHLVVANWLEQRPRAASSDMFIRRNEFHKMRKYLRPAVRQALDKAYGFNIAEF